MDEYLHLMPSSRARLGSLPWALCVRTLHRPFRSSRHRDISFNRGPDSFRQDPGVTFSVSSSGRLWFCGDKNTERKTRSRVNQDRAFQGNIQSLILNYGSTMKPRLSHLPLEIWENGYFHLQMLLRTQRMCLKCDFSILHCSVGGTFRVWMTKLNNCVHPDTDYQCNSFPLIRAYSNKHYKKKFISSCLWKLSKTLNGERWNY